MIGAFLRSALPGGDVLVEVAADVAPRPGDEGSLRGTGVWPDRRIVQREGQGWGQGGGPGRRDGPPGGYGMSNRGGHGPLAHAVMSWRGMQAEVDLGGGQWLSFATALPETGPVISTSLMLAVAASAGLIALLTALAARRITAPIRFLSDAASRLGRTVEAPALPETGTVEVCRAAQAFNEMQSRLRRLIENRR